MKQYFMKNPVCFCAAQNPVLNLSHPVARPQKLAAAANQSGVASSQMSIATNLGNPASVLSCWAEFLLANVLNYS